MVLTESRPTRRRAALDKSRLTNFPKPGDSIRDPGYDQGRKGERGQNVGGKSDSPDLPITVSSEVIDGDKGCIDKGRKERCQKCDEENKDSDVAQTIEPHWTIDQIPDTTRANECFT